MSRINLWTELIFLLLCINGAFGNVNRNVSVEVLSVGGATDDKVDEYFKVINKKLEKLIETVGKFTGDTEMGFVSDIMPTESENFEKYSNAEQGANKLDELQIELCIERIQNRKIARAVEIFKDIYNREKYIKRIVSQIYDENAENIDLIIQFLEKIPGTFEKYLFAWSLYDEIVLNMDFNKTEAKHFFQVIEKLSGSSEVQKFTDFNQKNVKMMANILSSYHTNILSLSENDERKVTLIEIMDYVNISNVNMIDEVTAIKYSIQDMRDDNEVQMKLQALIESQEKTSNNNKASNAKFLNEVTDLRKAIIRELQETRETIQLMDNAKEIDDLKKELMELKQNDNVSSTNLDLEVRKIKTIVQELKMNADIKTAMHELKEQLQVKLVLEKGYWFNHNR